MERDKNMGLFDFLRRQDAPARPEPVAADYAPGIVCSPVSGTAMQLSETSDPVFSSGAMGPGVAVAPTGEIAYAPVTGTVSAAMPHAVGIVGDDGAEVLVHVGMDTVAMGGDGLSSLVSQGERVSAGQPVASFSRDKIASAGKDDTVFVIVTNGDEFAGVTPVENGPIEAGDAAVRLSR